MKQCPLLGVLCFPGDIGFESSCGDQFLILMSLFLEGISNTLSLAISTALLMSLNYFSNGCRKRWIRLGMKRNNAFSDILISPIHKHTC